MHVKKYKTQKIVSLSIVLAFASVFAFCNYYQNTPFEEVPSENIKKNPKQADIVWTYNLTTEPGIFLYGNDWSSWVDSYEWLTGAGTEGNPYEIRNVYFDGEDRTMNLIQIQNSDVHFRIRDCILINTYDYDYDEYWCNAIFLNNVENGRISNVITSECMTGIRLENSNYNRITGIFTRDNDRSGITVSGGKTNRIRNNTMSEEIGVRLIGGTFNNDVEENIITAVSEEYGSYDDIGITLSNSNYNNISFNTISDFEQNIGIYVNGLGNNISGNAINNSLSGLYLGNSHNNYVSENLIVGGSNGITISQSSGNNVVMNNVSDSNFYGIFGENSNNETISENTVTNSARENIYLYNTLGVDLALNQMYGHGLYFDIPYSDLAGINIESSNLVNGKSIYLYINQSGLGLTEFINAGQIFLYECDTVLIEDQDFSYVSTGITMVNCSNSILSLNEAFNNSRWAFSLIDSNYNQILNNDITGSIVILEGCDHNELVGNTISYSMTDGLSLENCGSNYISGNVVSYNNDVGIRLFTTNHTLIHDNVVNFNAVDGISVKVKNPEWVYINDDWVEVIYYSINISLTSNEINDNQLRGVLIDDVEDFNIIDNTVMRNKEGIYLNDFESGFISENEVIGNQIGLKLVEGSDVFISNNTVNSNIEYSESSTFIRGGAGIIISVCYQLEVNDNTVIGNAQGMKISDCSGCEVESNLISENSDQSSSFFLFTSTPRGNAGMHIVDCFNVNLTGNILNNNGIGLEGTNHCNLLLNQISGFGFELENSDGNIISGNLITGALIAIDLKSSSYNNITYNIIVAQQCFRERLHCISNVFENNDCTEVLPNIFLREIISLIGLASILGLNIPLILKKRKQRK